MKNILLTDQEQQVIQTALYELLAIKSGQLSRTEDILTHFSSQKLNEYDILSPPITNASALSILEKLKSPIVTTFANPQQKPN